MPDSYECTAEPWDVPRVVEVTALRAAAGWDDDTAERWADVLVDALCVASARTPEGALVGMGVLTGSVRHAVLCDLVVHPEHRHQGLGRTLIELRLEAARRLGCRYVYVGLSDENPFAELYDTAGLTIAARTGELRR